MARGYFCLALDNAKTAENIGGVLRAAYCYGAAQVVVSGDRAKAGLNHATNTPKAHRHMPVFIGTDDPLEPRPFDCQVVAIEVLEGATPLQRFWHPARALYVFGAEDNTLGRRITDRAQHVVYVPTRACMNLAACVNVVLYDRLVKLGAAVEAA
jgi:tRNA(Leu) C34 or U34 (ribose-2'-O)-methylase TrmL